MTSTGSKTAAFIFILIALTSLAGTAFAQGIGPCLMGTDLGVHSKYVWRGLVFDEKPVLQPDFWMSMGGVSAVFWGNMDLTDQGDNFEGQFNEWDVYLTFPLYNWDLLQLGGEIDYLSFPSASGKAGSVTSEISLNVTANTLASPRISLFWDVWQYHGLYANFSLFHSWQAGPGSLGLFSCLGWGNDAHNVQSGQADSGGLLDLGAAVKYSFSINNAIAITPGIHFSSILQSDIRDYYDSMGIAADNLYFSLSAALTCSH